MRPNNNSEKTQEYKVGESYIFLTTDFANPSEFLKNRGTIRGTGVTLDGMPYVDVDFGGSRKKYVISVLRFRKMDILRDPSILGEVMVVKRSVGTLTAGDVKRVIGLPGEVEKVAGERNNLTGEVTRVKDNK